MECCPTMRLKLKARARLFDPDADPADVAAELVRRYGVSGARQWADKAAHEWELIATRGEEKGSTLKESYRQWVGHWQLVAQLVKEPTVH